MFSLSQTVAPTAYPVSIVEAKAHCRIDTDDEQALLGGMVRAATEHVERMTRRQLMTATFRQYMDDFPCEADQPIRLMRNPVQSVSSVVYVDEAGASQTWSAANYLTDLVSEPARITPVYGGYWPSTRIQLNAVYVQFVAGYASKEVVPDAIKIAIAMLAANWFENRESTISGVSIAEVPMAVDRLLWPYRLLEAA